MSEDKSQDLEQQVWYHGFRPRKDVETLLLQPGDYLVRATESQKCPQLVLSFMYEKKVIRHFTIKFDPRQKKWHLGVLKEGTKHKVQLFANVVSLIDYYKTNTGPAKMKLKNGIPKPDYCIKHDRIEFNQETDLIGQGNFCRVYRGTYTQTDPAQKTIVAVKTCHEENRGEEEGKKERGKMLAEAELMSYYSHENVIKLCGVACDRPPVLIVMEFCIGGNLEEHLKRFKETIETGERIVYALEASRGMRYLHAHQFVHRDIAARNCLISTNGSIKIADFGLSKFMPDLCDQSTKTDPSKDSQGTSTTASEDEGSAQVPLRWMAPESLKRPMQFSRASDVWSFGVLVYELIIRIVEIFNEGEKPWKDEPVKKVASMIRKGQMPSMPPNTPEDLSTFIANGVWKLTPTQRVDMRAFSKTLKVLHEKHQTPTVEKFILNTVAGVKKVAVCPDLDDEYENEVGAKKDLRSSIARLSQTMARKKKTLMKERSHMESQRT